MELSKFVACTVCAVTALAAVGCADGTGQALIPTLPTVDATASNADGTKLKASAPQPMSPQSAIRISNLTPQLGRSECDRHASILPRPCHMSSRCSRSMDRRDARRQVRSDHRGQRSDDVERSGEYVEGEQDLRVARLRRVWRRSQGSLSDGVSFRTPLPPPTDGPVAVRWQHRSGDHRVCRCCVSAISCEDVRRERQPGAPSSQHGVHPGSRHRDRHLQGPRSRPQLQARHAGHQPRFHRSAQQHRQAKIVV